MSNVYEYLKKVKILEKCYHEKKNAFINNWWTFQIKSVSLDYSPNYGGQMPMWNNK